MQPTTSPPSTDSSNTSKQTLLRLALVVTTILVFANSAPNDFVFDDTAIIRDNPLVRGPLDIPAIFSSNYWISFADRDTLYRPMTILSFALENAIFGSSPLAVHISNILLNAAVALLLLWVLQASTGRRFFSYASAFLFATMPLHSEVVANGVGRAELLAAFFSLCGMASYLWYVRRRSWNFTAPNPVEHISVQGESDTPEPDIRAIVLGLSLAGVFYFLSMCCKESAVMWPLALFVLDWLLIEQGSWRSLSTLLPRFACFVLPAAGYLVLRNSVVGLAPPQAHVFIKSLPSWQRVLLAAEIMLGYFHQILYPIGLSADYFDFVKPRRPGFADAKTISTLFAWGAISALCFIGCRAKVFLPVVGVLWFLIMIFPTSNLVIQIGVSQADRLAYVPSMGLAICIGWMFAILATYQRKLAVTICALAVLVQSGFAFFQNQIWRSKASLWNHAVTISPNSPDAWRNVGDTYLEQKNYPKAIESFERSRMLKAQAGFFNREATLLLAKTYGLTGEIDSSVKLYRELLQRHPDHLVAMLSLGQQLLRRQETALEALNVFNQASERFPQDFHVWAHRAEAKRKLGQLEEALEDIDQALTLNQSARYVWRIRAEILAQLGRAEEAERAKSHSLAAGPNQPRPAP